MVDRMLMAEPAALPPPDAQALCADLGLVLEQLAGVVPNGLVAFFPSFQYLEQVLAAWRHSGQLQRLETRKKARVRQAPPRELLCWGCFALKASWMRRQPLEGSNVSTAGNNMARSQLTTAGVR